jgi:hypothetical protein
LARIEDARERTARRISDLIDAFDAIVASSEAANLDDEHDPEGATVGFERAQVSALLESARAQLAELAAPPTASKAVAMERVRSAADRSRRRPRPRNRPHARASAARAGSAARRFEFVAAG